MTSKFRQCLESKNPLIVCMILFWCYVIQPPLVFYTGATLVVDTTLHAVVQKYQGFLHSIGAET